MYCLSGYLTFFMLRHKKYSYIVLCFIRIPRRRFRHFINLQIYYYNIQYIKHMICYIHYSPVRLRGQALRVQSILEKPPKRTAYSISELKTHSIFEVCPLRRKLESLPYILDIVYSGKIGSSGFWSEVHIAGKLL